MRANRIFMALALGVSAFWAEAPHAMAQETGTTSLSAASPALRKILLADDLVALGREAGDAVLLIAAARLLAGDAGSVDRAGDLEAGPTSTSLLDEALALAGDRPAERALAEKLRADIVNRPADAQRGILNALGDGKAFITKVGKLGPNKTFQSPVWTFAGGAYAEVHVKGQGKGNVDIYVRTDDGKLICADTDSANESYCGWNPRKTQGFVITVENRSPVATPFRLTTN